jgi:hypothetical protein
MKTILVACIAGLFLISAFGAVALPGSDSITMNENGKGRNDYTHTVLAEEASATWCGYCPEVMAYMHQLYDSGSYDFYYVTLLDPQGTGQPWPSYRISELGVTGYPTVVFDGGYSRLVGAGHGLQAYINSLNNCGARTVADIDLSLSVSWDGDAVIGVTADITNNGASDYSGHIHAYVTEINSRWYNAGQQYHFAMIGDYALNKNVYVPAGDTIHESATWDGKTYGFGNIQENNIMVIASAFDASTKRTDDTAGATPQTNNAPNKPAPPTGPTNGVSNVLYNYSGNTTDPNGDAISYQFDWGDGTFSNWLGPYPSGTTVESPHAWTYGGTYNLKLRAKDATDEGPWSNPLTVHITGGPNIEINNVKGGLFRVSAEIKNTGNGAVSNVNWNITLHNGAFIGKKTSGVNLTIPANSSVTIQSGLILGLGSTIILVQAWIPDGPSSMVQKSGSVLLFFIKVNP